MTPIRKFFYYLAGFAAFLCLIQLPFAFAISSVLSSPDHIDSALKEGGVYDNAITIALDEAVKKQGENKQPGDVNKDEGKDLLADQGVKDAITSSVQPSDIQSASRSAIGGIFAWLQGKTAQPEFTIDLSEPANKAVENLAAYAQKRAAGLPACTVEQLRTVDQGDFLSIPCLPPGVSAAQVGQQVSEQAKNEVEFLKDPVIDSKELIKEEDAAQLRDSQAPVAYQALHNNKWVTLAVTVILVSLLIFARRDRWAGIRYVSILLLVVTVLLGIVLLASTVGKANIPVANDKVAEAAVNTILNLASQIMSVVRWFVLGYAVLGVAGLIIGHKLKPTEPKHEHIETTEAPEPPKAVV